MAAIYSIPQDTTEISMEEKTLIVSNMIGNHVKRGDIIQFGGKGYRNGNLLFWDGEKLIRPSYYASNYGSVPEYFEVGDGTFGILHWIGRFDYNDRIIWLTEPLYRKIIPLLESSGKGYFTCVIDIDGKPIRINTPIKNIIGKAMRIYDSTTLELY
jgi:hypothetical protein